MHLIYLLIRATLILKNDKNRLNKIGMNDNNLIQSFRKFKIKYNSLLVKTLINKLLHLILKSVN